MHAYYTVDAENNKDIVGVAGMRELFRNNSLRVLNMGFRPQRENVMFFHRKMLPLVP